MGKKKDYIPVGVKNNVWNMYCIYPLNREITKCCTCTNLVLIPESIRKMNNIPYNIKVVRCNGIIQPISGTAEYGHIISEKNGGKVSEDNLIIQCKPCNVRQGFENIENYCSECNMIDVVEEDSIEMGENYEFCQRILKSGKNCKNKTIFNRMYCHIHLNF